MDKADIDKLNDILVFMRANGGEAYWGEMMDGFNIDGDFADRYYSILTMEGYIKRMGKGKLGRNFSVILTDKANILLVDGDRYRPLDLGLSIAKNQSFFSLPNILSIPVVNRQENSTTQEYSKKVKQISWLKNFIKDPWTITIGGGIVILILGWLINKL